MKKHVVLTVFIALAVVAWFLAVRHFKNDGQDANAPILVAANYPMTGELAFYGAELRDGMLMAVSENAESIAPGTKIAFDWGDNKFSAKEAATVLQRQLRMKPTIYASALKPQVMAIEHEVESAGIPHLAWVLDLTPNPSGTKDNFRTWVSFKLECDVFAGYARAKGAKNVVLCYLSLPSTEEAYGRYLKQKLSSDVGCTVTIEKYNPDVAAKDYANIAAKVASLKPDMILINGFIPHMVGLIKSIRPLGVIAPGNTMAALDMLDAADALSASESEGIIVAAPPFMIKPTEQQTQWVSRFKEKYGRPPSYHAAFAHDAGITILNAAKSKPTTKQQWLDAILATDASGVTGPIKFGSDRSQVTSLMPAIYRGGKLVPLQ